MCNVSQRQTASGVLAWKRDRKRALVCFLEFFSAVKRSCEDKKYE